MKHLRFFTILLVFVVVAAMFLVPFKSSSSPNPPDAAPVDSFEDYMDAWEKSNMDPAAKNVHDAYDDFEGLVGEYQSAINGFGGVVFSAVGHSVQTSWVGMVMGVYKTSKEDAMNKAKTQTLQSAVEEAASAHSSYLDKYNDLFDRNGTVNEDSVRKKIQSEIEENGSMSITAETMMEAHYRYEYLIAEYNKQVDAYNAYKNASYTHRYTVLPPRALFGQFYCFGGCGTHHDTMAQARDENKAKCGTAANIDELRHNAPIGPTMALRTINDAFNRRSVDQGCGRHYYKCNPEHKWQHEKKTRTENGSTVEYRNCLPHTTGHDDGSLPPGDDYIPDPPSDPDAPINPIPVGEDDDQISVSPGLSTVGASTTTINGEEMVDVDLGDTVSVNLVMPSDKGYSRITWHLAGPYTDSSAGAQTSVTTSLSSDIETSASHSFTLPSDAPVGVYRLTASISPHSSASVQTVYEYSLKIYVD